MISAYKNHDNSLIAVIINYSTDDKEIKIETSNTPPIVWQPYITSDNPGFNLKKLPLISNNKIKLPAKSIVTLKEI